MLRVTAGSTRAGEFRTWAEIPSLTALKQNGIITFCSFKWICIAHCRENELVGGGGGFSLGEGGRLFLEGSLSLR